MDMNIEFFAASDPGLTRDNNEDAVCFDAPTHIAVLADGMGGYNAGEVASAMASTFIREEMARWLTEAGHLATPREIARALSICVSNANHSIFNAARNNNQYAGMGTTLVTGVFNGPWLILGHIGDSRCYLHRAKKLTQLTRDHSLLQEQLDAGLITLEQASLSNQKNLVTRALGVDPDVQLETAHHRIHDKDCYLFCSDGLSDMVDNEQITRVLSGGGSLEHMANELIGLANANGGVDNISVFLARVSSKVPKKAWVSRWFG
jgi:serine/threonine protein phosphatase PrpC